MTVRIQLIMFKIGRKVSIDIGKWASKDMDVMDVGTNDLQCCVDTDSVLETAEKLSSSINIFGLILTLNGGICYGKDFSS